ncbi:MAG: hypothetical protein M1834_009420 [Cirrosporium novae-zelandiae]|nr:MAG: hypothetical protein M1834_009420 [Cirrosporium novae-zelandiae]
MIVDEKKTIYQPIYPDVRPKLDLEYVAFHDKHLQYVVPDDSQPWDPAIRTRKGPMAAGQSPLSKVGDTRDIKVSNWEMRVFTPEGNPPEGGWPVFLWHHGGGWTIGGINAENDFCTLMCKSASCVVITVGYRHAPEFKYPTAINDCIETLNWVITTGPSSLNTNKNRIAIGGTSAGSNLSAILALKAASSTPPVPLLFQLLIVPVIDNTATADTVWAPNQKAPWLTPGRMMWYRRLYLPDEKDWGNWDSSPNMAPEELLKKTPRTWMAISEQDLLAPEGLAYAAQLRGLGVQVETTVYKGMTHSILGLNGILTQGKQLMRDSAEALRRAFNEI